MGNFISKNKFTTPVLTVVRENLVQPKLYTNEKTGNMDTKFELKLFGSPETDEDANSFFQELEDASTAHSPEGKSAVVKRTIKNRATNAFEDHPTDLAITLRSSERPLVTEMQDGKQVIVDNLQIPSGSKVVAEGEVVRYSIPGGRSGISLKMRSLKIVERKTTTARQ